MNQRACSWHLPDLALDQDRWRSQHSIPWHMYFLRFFLIIRNWLLLLTIFFVSYIRLTVFLAIPSRRHEGL